MRELHCNEFVELVTDFLEGVMDAASEARFLEHLRFCEGRGRHLDQLRTTIGRARPSTGIRTLAADQGL